MKVSVYFHGLAESILLLADNDLWLELELVRLLALEPI